MFIARCRLIVACFLTGLWSGLIEAQAPPTAKATQAEPKPPATREDAQRMLDALQKQAKSEAVLVRLQDWLKEQRGGQRCRLTAAKFEIGPTHEISLVLSGEVEFGFQKMAIADGARNLLIDEYGTLYGLTPPRRDVKTVTDKPDSETKKPTAPTAKPNDDPVPPPPPPPRAGSKNTATKGATSKPQPSGPALPLGFPIPQLDDVKIKSPSADSFVAKLQASIKGQAEFHNCTISSGKFLLGADDVDQLELSGQVTSEFQRRELDERVAKLLSDEFATSFAAPTPIPTPVLDQLKLVRPSAEPALARIQMTLGQNPEWDGIQITQARYEDDQDRTILVVEGRLSEARLRSVAQKICGTVMQETFGAAGGAFPVPKLDQLPVVKPSQSKAVEAFNEGVAHYRKGNYEAAHQEITRAIFENPFNQSYKYWLVVTEIAAGHDDQARRLLRPLVLRRTRARSAKQADEYTDVLRRLESVQGTVRQKMNRLEEELLREPAAK